MNVQLARINSLDFGPRMLLSSTVEKWSERQPLSSDSEIAICSATRISFSVTDSHQCHLWINFHFVPHFFFFRLVFYFLGHTLTGHTFQHCEFAAKPKSDVFLFFGIIFVESNGRTMQKVY